MLTDPIADFLTRIRNASHSRRGQLTVRSSRMTKALSQLLAVKRFIEGFEEVEEGSTRELAIRLRIDREPLELKRISKPGQRIYVGHDEIKRVRNGLGMAVISTNKGILSGEDAKKEKVGGEYICEVY